jgi:excisionase family DNA binding protein
MSANHQFSEMPWLTVSEAARYMGVGKSIIYQLIEFGEVRAVRRKRAILVEQKSLEAYLESGRLM